MHIFPFVGISSEMSDETPTKQTLSEISTQFRPQSEEKKYMLRNLFRCFEFFVLVEILSVYRRNSNENYLAVRFLRNSDES